jgi:basic amino acid/polyamine antiporter, APA family
MMGLGSIVGTGVFVSLGLAAGLAGTAMLLALFLAGCLAICNGLSSAQLAAAHPVSGGTYEYGYKYLNPWLGFLAGWLFVCAKSASAATAAIGFGGYFARLLSIEVDPWILGLVGASLVIGISLMGMQRTSFINALIVSITLIALGIYVSAMAGSVSISMFQPFFLEQHPDDFAFPSFFEAAALMFVAYTGYGRIATLGEEIADPVRNIPKAVIITLAISFALYLAVATVSIGVVGPSNFYNATIEETAPLEVIASIGGQPLVARILAVGAITAMLGVLLNLLLGVSRVIFAMSRKDDLPPFLASISRTSNIPHRSVMLTGGIILLLVLLQDIKLTWSFSAFTVLFYYAITNAAALRLPPELRLYPRLFAWLGLIGCLSLSVWVEWQALLLGTTVIAGGVIWRFVFQFSKRI